MLDDRGRRLEPQRGLLEGAERRSVCGYARVRADRTDGLVRPTHELGDGRLDVLGSDAVERNRLDGQIVRIEELVPERVLHRPTVAPTFEP